MRILLFLLAVVFLNVSVIHAQSGAGTIQGTVTDTAGALVANVQVTVTQETTHSSVTTTTNQTGFYILPGLFTGRYTLTFTEPQFATATRNLQLMVAQTAQVDVTLTVGGVTTSVDVVADHDTQLVTTDSGTVNATLENERINQLPMNSRRMLQLTQITTPGLEGTGQRANGNMSEGLEYVQDGVPSMNRNFGNANVSDFAQFPDPDAIEQIKVEMAASSAQFSTPATGIITTKSGTNSLHGSLFETARNNSFGVSKGRNFGATGVLPHLVRNEFGVSVGGPIRIPHLYNGTDRSFFFFAFERYSLRQSNLQLSSVPTQAMRNGDFSGLLNGNGVLQVIYDPQTTQSAIGHYARTPFAGNIINGSRQSPLSKVLNSISPLPSTADNPLVRGNYYLGAPNYFTVPNTTFRLDHQFNQSNRAYLRYTDIRQDVIQIRNSPNTTFPTLANASLGIPAAVSGYQKVPVSTVTGAIGLIHVFSPTFISETILGQQWFNQQVTAGGDVNTNYETIMGLPNNFGETGFPQITGSIAAQFGGTQFNYGDAQIVTNLDENLTKILARHKLQFGFRFRHERFGYLPDRLNDNVTFGNLATALYDTASGSNWNARANTGQANADLYLGHAASYTVHISAPYVHFSDQEFDSYIQDSWKATKNFTIDIGLRWEAHPALDTDGLVQAFDFKNKAVVMQNPIQYYLDKKFTVPGVIANLTNLGVKFELPSVAGLPHSIFKSYNYVFSPRVGFAYSPWGAHGFVFRAGYGRYIYPRPARNSVTTSVVNNEPFTAPYTMSYTAGNQAPDGQSNYLLRSVPAVIAGQNSSNAVDSTGPSALQPGQVFTTLAPNGAPQFVTQVAVTAEQPLPGESALRVTYVFDHGTNLDQGWRYNSQPSPWLYQTMTGNPMPTGTYANTALGVYDQITYGNSMQINPTGYSNHNALQANYQHFYKHGYSYQAYYVYASTFRVGGNSTRDGIVYPKEVFLASTLQGTDYQSLNRLQNYTRDTAIPRHHIGINGVLDMPFGRNKRFLGGVNKFWDQVIGGYQLAGNASIVSQSFAITATNWGSTSPLHVWRDSRKIQDCRSGKCHLARQWYNGYISPKFINAATSGITGLRSDYVPYQTPINNDPSGTNFGNNNVLVRLNNNTNVTDAYNPGPAGVNPFSHSILSGPIKYSVDTSLFKVFPIHEKMAFRVNVDAFNVFNIQGYANPDASTGLVDLTAKSNDPRVLQLTARFTF